MADYFIEDLSGALAPASNSLSMNSWIQSSIPVKFFRYICYVDITPNYEEVNMSRGVRPIDLKTKLFQAKGDYLEYLNAYQYAPSNLHNEFQIVLFFKRSYTDEEVKSFYVLPVSVTIDKQQDSENELASPNYTVLFHSGDASKKCFRIPLLMLIELVNYGRSSMDIPLQNTIKDLKSRGVTLADVIEMADDSLLSSDVLQREYPGNLIPQLIEPSLYSLTGLQKIKLNKKSAPYSQLATYYSSTNVTKVANIVRPNGENITIKYWHEGEDGEKTLTDNFIRQKYIEPLEMPEIYRHIKMLNQVNYLDGIKRGTEVLIGRAIRWKRVNRTEPSLNNYIGRGEKPRERTNHFIYAKSLAEWVALFSHASVGFASYTFKRYMLPFIDAVIQGGDSSLREDLKKEVDQDIEMLTGPESTLLMRVPDIHEILYLLQFLFNKNYYDKNSIVDKESVSADLRKLSSKKEQEKTILAKKDSNGVLLVEKYPGYPSKIPDVPNIDDPNFDKYYFVDNPTPYYYHFESTLYEGYNLYNLFNHQGSVMLGPDGKPDLKTIKLLYRFFRNYTHLIIYDYGSDNKLWGEDLQKSVNSLVKAINNHEVLLGLYVGGVNTLYKLYADLFGLLKYASVNDVLDEYKTLKAEEEIKNQIRYCGILLSAVIEHFHIQYKQDVIARRTLGHVIYEDIVETVVLYLGDAILGALIDDTNSAINDKSGANFDVVNTDLATTLHKIYETLAPNEMQKGFKELQKEVVRIRELGLTEIFGSLKSVINQNATSEMINKSIEDNKVSIAYTFKSFFKEINYSPEGQRDNKLFRGNNDFERMKHYREIHNVLRTSLGLIPIL